MNQKSIAAFRYALIGNGRAGKAFALVLRRAGKEVVGPLGRDEYRLIDDCDVVLLCVPDREIENVAARIEPGPIVGHCSGAVALAALAPHERFGLHPLKAIAKTRSIDKQPGLLGSPPLATGDITRNSFAGASCAIAGSSDRALELARYMAELLGMEPFLIDDCDRRAYHAAASIAGNLPIALWEVAAKLAESKSVDRRHLVSLIQSTLNNWERDGARALTGPIARGDTEIVEAQREVIGAETPDFLPLFDELVSFTGRLRSQSLQCNKPDFSVAMQDLTPVMPPVIRSINELRTQLDPIRRSGQTIGFVPTMGALHRGHCTLVDVARTRCDCVVMSSFVNPRQFNDPADFANYPRDEAADRKLANEHGVDIFFAPNGTEIYREGATTTISVGRLATVYEGAQRPGHFDGVCTVVAKLLNIVSPDVLFLGQKDAQQVAVISQMVDDLDFPVEVAVVPTVRDDDGVALSSRNVRLTAAQRTQAKAIPLALAAAQRHARSDHEAYETQTELEPQRQPLRNHPPGEKKTAPLIATARSILNEHGIEPEYLDVVDGSTFETEAVLSRKSMLIVAARIGEIRLLDNAYLLGEVVAANCGGDSNNVESLTY